MVGCGCGKTQHFENKSTCVQWVFICGNGKTICSTTRCEQDIMNQQCSFKQGLHVFCPKISFLHEWIFGQNLLQTIIKNVYSNYPKIWHGFLFIIFE